MGVSAVEEIIIRIYCGKITIFKSLLKGKNYLHFEEKRTDRWLAPTPPEFLRGSLGLFISLVSAAGSLAQQRVRRENGEDSLLPQCSQCLSRDEYHDATVANEDIQEAGK